MSDLITKLQRIKQTKKEIKDAINAKGSSCNTECFREYPDRILAIQGGGDEDLSYILELIGDGKLNNGDNWQSLEEIIVLVGGDITSVEKQLQELIEQSNKTTGRKDSTLTESVDTLVAGYGQGGGSRSFHFHYREALYHTDIKMMPDPCNGTIHPMPISSIIGRYKLIVQEVQQ